MMVAAPMQVVEEVSPLTARLRFGRVSRSLHSPVRPRMPWWRGERGRESPGYPTRWFSISACRKCPATLSPPRRRGATTLSKLDFRLRANDELAQAKTFFDTL